MQAVTWKWALATGGALRKLSWLGGRHEDTGQEALQPAPSQPHLLFISPSFGSACELLSPPPHRHALAWLNHHQML